MLQHFLSAVQATCCFAVIISIIVFIHEFGHYFFAKYFGVKVEVFSIGFGKELCGYTNSFGTRWRLSLIPLGGYVKMFGDADPSSSTNIETMQTMTEAEKASSFYHKPLWQKAIIVVAGPLANYLSAIIVLGCLFLVNGKVVISPEIGSVITQSPAEQAGLRAGDVVVSIDSSSISNFNELQEHVALNAGEAVVLGILRNSLVMEVVLTPELRTLKNEMGEEVKTYVLGLTASGSKSIRLNAWESLYEGFRTSMKISVMMLQGVWQMLTGYRDANEIGGPIKIAKYSQKSVEQGLGGILSFIALLSINLGLLNLLPIPLLDGGHLAYYMFQAALGRPLSQKIQMHGFRIGMGLLMALTCFAILNDIKSLFVQ